MPAELRDRGDAVWQTEEATAAWRLRHGLPVERLKFGPLNRHQRAAEAWAVSAGVVSRLGLADWRKLGELGVPLTGQAASRERHPGIRFLRTARERRESVVQ
jgi:hypothetical protein